MESRRCCGSRNDIVWVDGFRFGSTATCAFFQSRYSVESFFSQNARSAASLGNFGTVLRRLLINGSLLPMHISGRNDSNELVAISQRKGDMKLPAVIGFSKGVKARLRPTVLVIQDHHDRGIEKYLLGLRRRNA